MPPVKTAYVPRFGSQQSSGSQRSEAVDQAHAGPNHRGDKRGMKRGNERPARNVLKVKLPKLSGRGLLGKASKDDEMPTLWIPEPNPNKTKATVNQGGESCGADADSAPDNRDVFAFSQRSDITTTDEKEKVKNSVLRNISKMLEENQLIRQRLAALSQAV